MKVALVGRAGVLLRIGRRLHIEGHDITLVVTAPPAPEYDAKEKDFEDFARQVGAHYILSTQLSAEFLAPHVVGKVDVGVSWNFVSVIDQSVIDLFPQGVLNAHGGDLPRYRGNACTAWAIVNGEKHIGLSIHQMVGGAVDAGDIFSKRTLPIYPETRVADVYEWFDYVLPDMYADVLAQLASGKIQPIAQPLDGAEVLRCFPRCPDDGLIRWEKDACEILRLINASSEPYEGAFAVYRGKRLRVWRARPGSLNYNYLAIPGQLIHEAGEWKVICGSGILTLLEIEFEGVRGLPHGVLKGIRNRLKNGEL